MAVDDLVDPELIDLIHDPVLGNMYSVAFASGSGTNFREAVSKSRESGSNFEIGLLVTDKERKKGKSEPIGAITYANKFGIPVTTENVFKIRGSWQEARKTVEGIERFHENTLIANDKLLERVQKFEREHGRTFDLAVLAGYMCLFNGSLLTRFDSGRKAINVHPADLALIGGNGRRLYTGDNAVYAALEAGERRTRSSVILLNHPEPDCGAILVQGPWIEYTGPRKVTPESAGEHQEKQKAASDWPALKFALRAIARGEFGLHKKRKHHEDGNPVVVYQGRAMLYGGYDGHSLAA